MSRLEAHSDSARLTLRELGASPLTKFYARASFAEYVQGSFTQIGHATRSQEKINQVHLEAAGVDGWLSADGLWAMALACTSELEVLPLLDDGEFMEELQRQSTQCGAAGRTVKRDDGSADRILRLG